MNVWVAMILFSAVWCSLTAIRDAFLGEFGWAAFWLIAAIAAWWAYLTDWRRS